MLQKNIDQKQASHWASRIVHVCTCGTLTSKAQLWILYNNRSNLFSCWLAREGSLRGSEEAQGVCGAQQHQGWVGQCFKVPKTLGEWGEGFITDWRPAWKIHPSIHPSIHAWAVITDDVNLTLLCEESLASPFFHKRLHRWICNLVEPNRF